MPSNPSPLRAHRWLVLGLACAGAAALPACVSERCFEDGDCPSPRICGASGACELQCESSADCSANFECLDHRCIPRSSGPIACPGEMVAVANAFCVDRYEASRVDATATSAGTDGARARSVASVLPWLVADNATAAAACAAAGKRLCAPEEWNAACRGPDGTAYSYGETYEPKTCNGIDAFGRQDFHLAPTGSFPSCTNEWGVFDINGNVWEHVAGGDDTTIRGGAYNCGDSAALHRCDYVPGSWAPSARGFRCCLTPTTGPGLPDAGAADGALAQDGGGGCLELPDGGPAGADAGAPDAGARDAAEPAGDASAPDSGEPESDAGARPDAGAEDAGAGTCPPEMAPVGSVCVDRYEASREDATATSAGSSETVARSRAGVLPWYVNPMTPAALAKFEAACQASGKRLCGPDEWLESCRGPGRSAYSFGDAWDPTVCNSVDTYCRQCCDALGLASCPSGENCGYNLALSSSPYTPETCSITAAYGLGTCHVCFHVMPTGSFPGCVSEAGLFDVNGNVWEVVPVPTAVDGRGYQVRGGAFNCAAPSLRFECSFNAAWTDLYAGFRCCKERTP